MRVSDLLKLEAVDTSGERLGHVHDVRFTSVGGGAVGWTAASLIVGRGGFAARLGYAHGAVTHPRLLAAALAWLTRHALEIPWQHVTEVREDRVVVAGSRADFAAPSRGGREESR